MVKSINAVKARQKFGELIEEVYYRGDSFVVERSGRPMAAVVPLSLLEQWQRERDEDFKVFDEIWALNPDVDEEELGRDVDRAIAEVRAARRRRSKRSAKA